ncbi:MAG: aminodeoxychorismate/anthranilate synthase component II [Candidatus Thermoplasmatota archaeon]|jgi:anthranilate synthase/aminodeoxychorismate synthase-like glutamine amidotransferase|nr:aminodeoxychorismate/anthranilate synthase component II [Candidatus Thermoplasmatota archaeon]
MKVVLVDHEDSFVYNLAQALEAQGVDVHTVRYTVPFREVERRDADGFVLSPGPGHPRDRRVTGLARKILSTWGGERPVLGVCLGHQIIGDVYGGRVIHGTPVHGRTAPVFHERDPLYEGVPNPFAAARYHSLVVDRRSLPSDLVRTASTRDGTVMGLRHRHRPVSGVQFHPESFLTQGGSTLLANFLKEVRG